MIYNGDIMDKTVGGLKQSELEERWLAAAAFTVGAAGRCFDVSDSLKIRDDEGNICQLKIGKKEGQGGYYLYLIDHMGCSRRLS